MADFAGQHLLLSFQLPEGVFVVAALGQDFADLLQRKLEASQAQRSLSRFPGSARRTCGSSLPGSTVAGTSNPSS